MELQIIQQRALEPVKQKLTQLQTFDNPLQNAMQEKKISWCENETLTQALRYCMMIIGIREKNLPTQMEFDFLKDFLRRNFAGHTTAELKLAFEMATAGRLELGNDGAKCYENFSCEYLGRIMSAYRKWASQEFKGIQPVQQLALAAPVKADWKETCEDCYQKYLSGNYDMRLWPWQIYEGFVESGFMSEDNYILFLGKAKDIIKAEQKEDLQKSRESRMAGSVNDILEQMQKSDDNQVNNWAMRVAVYDLFSTEWNAGRKHFFVKQEG
jgi:hypothetical protein